MTPPQEPITEAEMEEIRKRAEIVSAHMQSKPYIPKEISRVAVEDMPRLLADNARLRAEVADLRAARIRKRKPRDPNDGGCHTEG